MIDHSYDIIPDEEPQPVQLPEESDISNPSLIIWISLALGLLLGLFILLAPRFHELRNALILTLVGIVLGALGWLIWHLASREGKEGL